VTERAIQVLMAEDDDGHATLVDYGLSGEMVRQLAGFLMTVNLPGEPAAPPTHGA
jgi:hypothetical protein